MNPLLKAQKIGFLGAGNMAQAMIKGLIEGGIPANHIYATNRSEGKLVKLVEQYKINSLPNNEDLIDICDIIILAVKPQDLLTALEPVGRAFDENKIVISVAAGVRMQMLERFLNGARIARVMPNTPSVIGRGVIGYLLNEDDDDALESTVEDLFEPLGRVIKVTDEDQFEALMISCSSGTGFVFEMMMYWQDWIEEHGFSIEEARVMTIETFVGASLLAAQARENVEDLQARVTSKKGVTAAGLQSMRELEIERALRISFEKAAMRNKEMAREIK
ncbi:pyrroline-5-carboxylate reductase [Bdellovibrio sp. KM01]|jgi:pyrroline-5-carboxylate reductase|uniref:pyrroline-5-carboxylate reductase family protein n=1 Tax=Bdellovibrio sp. KM01 TaxID=2748865 RepID=UPI0015E92810|nr:pyrroline-5-carboxylate reductase [Bdellovibrio sp. KM01]QLY25873.1 pyrroline-5-carboxylate reductase [Bdellovibrio sp. KM01]